MIYDLFETKSEGFKKAKNGSFVNHFEMDIIEKIFRKHGKYISNEILNNPYFGIENLQTLCGNIAMGFQKDLEKDINVYDHNKVYERIAKIRFIQDVVNGNDLAIFIYYVFKIYFHSKEFLDGRDDRINRSSKKFFKIQKTIKLYKNFFKDKDSRKKPLLFWYEDKDIFSYLYFHVYYEYPGEVTIRADQRIFSFKKKTLSCKNIKSILGSVFNSEIKEFILPKMITSKLEMEGRFSTILDHVETWIGFYRRSPSGKSLSEYYVFSPYD